MRERSNRKVDELRSFWKNYILQSLLATLTIFIVLLLLSMEHAVVIASIGATSFIVFAMPKSITARPRNVIGGHMVGLISGSLFSLIPSHSFLFSITLYSLAVGLSIFMMVVTDTEHPPAAGTALGVVVQGFSLNVAFAVITSSLILSAVHHILRPVLRDLT